MHMQIAIADPTFELRSTHQVVQAGSARICGVCQEYAELLSTRREVTRSAWQNFFEGMESWQCCYQ